jgi:glycosyltransferase involved in cell wall biosynthesis
MLDQITPVILTYNEAANIGRTLGKLQWARDIVVVDSMSTDATAELVGAMPAARLFKRPFDSHAAQWTYALTETEVETEWVLALDADYVLTDEFIAEMAALAPGPDVAGYSAKFRYCVAGKPLRGSLYPPVTVLFRRAKAHYRQDGHTQRVVIDGHVRSLDGRIWHDDRKSLDRWLSSQQRYTQLEADHLLSSAPSSLGWADRVRRLGWPAPILIFFSTLLWKGCLLDGWPGWLYALQRTVAEAMIALAVVDRRLHGDGGNAGRESRKQAGYSSRGKDATG